MSSVGSRTRVQVGREKREWEWWEVGRLTCTCASTPPSAHLPPAATTESCPGGGVCTGPGPGLWFQKAFDRLSPVRGGVGQSENEPQIQLKAQTTEFGEIHLCSITLKLDPMQALYIIMGNNFLVGQSLVGHKLSFSYAKSMRVRTTSPKTLIPIPCIHEQGSGA
jgi:hypothetical protein